MRGCQVFDSFMKRSRSPSPAHKFKTDPSPAVDCRRISSDRKKNERQTVVDNLNQHYFSADWEKIKQNGMKPNLRAGSSIVFDEKNQRIIFAYGQNPDDSFSSTFFQFSLKTYSWSVMNVVGTRGRSDTGCCIADDKIWFFGGSTENEFIREFHYLDLTTMKITFPETTGEHPPPCQTPLVFYSEKKLFVWSPVTGSLPSSLHVLDTETMVWKRVETEHIYRQGSNGAVVGKYLFVFGVSSPNTVLKLDLNSFDFSLVHTVGDEPPHGLEHMIVTSISNYIVCISTIGDAPLQHLYTFSPESGNWLRLSPKQNGLAGAPTAFFSYPKLRKLILVLQPDESDEDPCVNIGCIDSGKSLARINHELDLITVLSNP